VVAVRVVCFPEIYINQFKFPNSQPSCDSKYIILTVNVLSHYLGLRICSTIALVNFTSKTGLVAVENVSRLARQNSAIS